MVFKSAFKALKALENKIIPVHAGNRTAIPLLSNSCSGPYSDGAIPFLHVGKGLPKDKDFLPSFSDNERNLFCP
jgi:hypothetical protein